MLSKRKDNKSLRLLLALLALALLLAASLASAQDDETDADVPQDPLTQARIIARELVEEDIGYTMRLRRWRFYQDNWSSVASVTRYGTFGIDNCNASIPPPDKRDDVLFGWTFIFTETNDKEHSARVSFDLKSTVICDEAQVPPQYAPQPTAVPPAAVDAGAQAAPAAGSAANLAGFNLGGHVTGLDGNTIAKLKESRMTWVKKQVKFGVSDGKGFIDQAHANGFKVMLGALGDPNGLASDFDGYVARFAEYVGYLASLGADAIEVWNEPNIDREWPAGQINGGSYTRLLAAAYNAIKAANASTIVISGAPAPTGWFGAAGCGATGCNDDAFMRQMAQAGAANYMDCLGLHYNEGIVSPTQSSGDPRDSYPTRYFGSMLARGTSLFPGKKVCWTELGYLSPEGYGGLPSHFAWAGNVTVAQQAQWLADAARLSANSGQVLMMIVWNVNFTHWGADPQAGYAMIRPDGACPACGTLAAAMAG